MKKYYLTILTLMIAIFTFIGCSQNNADETSQKEMVIIVDSAVEDAAKDFAKYYMEKNPGLVVQIENPFSGSTEEKSANLQKWNTDITVGKGPDLYLLSTLLDHVVCENDEEQLLIKNVNKAMQNGVFASLDSYMEEDYFWEQSAYKKEILEAGKYHGKQYVLPLTCHYYVIVGEEEKVASIDSLQDFPVSAASNLLFYSSRWAQPAVNYEENQVLFEQEKWGSLVEQCFENLFAKAEGEDEHYIYSVEELETEEYESCMPLMNLDGSRVAAVELYGAVGMSSEYKEEAYEFLMLFLNGEVTEEKGAGFDIENRIVSNGVPVMENNKYYQQYPQILASYQEIEGAYFPTLIDRDIVEEIDKLRYSSSNVEDNISLKCDELAEKIYKKYEMMIKE